MEPFSKRSSHGVKYFEAVGVSVWKSGINAFMTSGQMMCAGVQRLQCDTCAENSFRLSAEWTSPCFSAGGDRCVLHLSALEKFCSALMWTVLTAHSIVLLPFTQ